MQAVYFNGIILKLPIVKKGNLSKFDLGTLQPIPGNKLYSKLLYILSSMLWDSKSPAAYTRVSSQWCDNEARNNN